MKAYFRSGLVCFAITVIGVARWLWREGRVMADLSPITWSFIILTPVLATIIVGTVAAGAKAPWSWQKMIFFSFGGWLLVIGLFGGVAGIYLWQAKQNPGKSLDELMTLHAEDAVARARAEFGVNLDYSAGSLTNLEQLLEQLHQRNVTNAFESQMLGREARLWGAYVGVMFKKMTEAEWQRDSKSAGEGSLPLKFKNGAEFFPCTWVGKRIVNGKEDNIIHKFAISLESLTKGVASITNQPGVTVLPP